MKHITFHGYEWEEGSDFAQPVGGCEWGEIPESLVDAIAVYHRAANKASERVKVDFYQIHYFTKNWEEVAYWFPLLSRAVTLFPRRRLWAPENMHGLIPERWCFENAVRELPSPTTYVREMRRAISSREKQQRTQDHILWSIVRDRLTGLLA